MKKKLIVCFWIIFLTFSSALHADSQNNTFTLPPLPYPKNALEPYISERTLTYHYGKHHKAYVKKLNKLVKEKNIPHGTLEEVIKLSAHDPSLSSVFNNAAQAWNHTFYWSSMAPRGGGKPTGPIAQLIKKSFGTYENFYKQFHEAGTNLFGSGWVWLVLDHDKNLKIVTTADADLPLIYGQKPMLVCDVWEHAYYLDYQNRRKDYVKVFLDHLVNWEFPNILLKI